MLTVKEERFAQLLAMADISQTAGAGDLVTGKARSGLRCMEAPAVSALPSIGIRSNLKSGIVRGGRSVGAR